MKNPWETIIDWNPNKLNVAEIDRDFISNNLKKLEDMGMKFNLLPEPFQGDITNFNNKSILILAAHPGYDANSDEKDIEKIEFRQECLNQLSLKFKDTDQFCLLGDCAKRINSGGYNWWNKRVLSKIIEALNIRDFEIEKIRKIKQQICCIEFYGYHSERSDFKYNIKKEMFFPSQTFSFDMVKDWMKTDKPIVIITASEWYKAIPELEKYKNLYKSKSQKFYLTEKNIANVHTNEPLIFKNIFKF